MDQTRRAFIARTMALGCSAASSPFVTPVTLASVPSDNRLVVIILRGAMDGLDVLRPVGDRRFAALRPDMDTAGQMDLGGMFALHPELAPLYPLWVAGEMSFAQAVSTPYRDKRSHFDGQDLLEAGYASISERSKHGNASGWLNRMLTLMPNVHSETAFAVGQDDLILLQGMAPHASWSPGRSLLMSTQGLSLMSRVFENDPLFHASAETAIELSAETIGTEHVEPDEVMDQMQENLKAARSSNRAKALAAFAAEQLQQTTRIAAFSIGGWDTHNAQKNAIKKPLNDLTQSLLTLKQDLGPVWEKTAVLCMTEFGRTVRLNGSAGTDHGTGGVMLMAGGAVRGSQVFGKWPGLSDGDLYRGRDLMPLSDVRSYAAYAMRGLFGIRESDLKSVVFPNLQMDRDPKIIL